MPLTIRLVGQKPLLRSRYLTVWWGLGFSALNLVRSIRLAAAPVQKLVKVEIVKGIRGSAYASGLESSIRDRLAYDDKYEEEEEATLEELVKYLSSQNLPVGSSIFFHWPSPYVVQVRFPSYFLLIHFCHHLDTEAWSRNSTHDHQWSGIFYIRGVLLQ